MDSKKNQNGTKTKPNSDLLCFLPETSEETDVYQQFMVQMMPRHHSQLFKSARAVLDPLGRICWAPKLQTALDSSSGLRIRRFSSRFQVIFWYGRNRGTPNSKFFILFCIMTDLSQSVIIQIPKRIQNASGTSNTPRTALTNLNYDLSLLLEFSLLHPHVQSQYANRWKPINLPIGANGRRNKFGVPLITPQSRT